MEQAGMGKMKMALVGVGDGLPAAEISTSALKAAARQKPVFNRVNEFGQSLEAIPLGREEEEEAEDGIRVLDPGAPPPESAPDAPRAVAKSIRQAKVARKVATKALEALQHLEPQADEIIGKVIFKANYMEMKIPVMDIIYQKPMILLFTPLDSDTSFEPPARAADIQLKIPGDLTECPKALTQDQWLDIYVTGLYFDVPKFGVRASIFYAQLDES